MLNLTVSVRSEKNDANSGEDDEAAVNEGLSNMEVETLSQERPQSAGKVK